MQMPNEEEVRTFLAGLTTGWGRDLRVAAGFFTRLPVARDAGGGDVPLADTARAFPVIGAGIGVAAGLALLGASWLGLPPLASAIIGLAVGAGITGALHEDGLADVADGFGGGATADEKLAIMRDSRIGAYGVLALIFAVGLRAAALAGLAGSALAGSALAAAALIAAASLSRAALPAVMAELQPVRGDGLGAAAGRPGRAAAITAGVIGTVVAVLLLGPVAGIAAVLAGAAAAFAVALLARRQIGGHTGDVLGAVQQAAETAILLAAAAVLG